MGERGQAGLWVLGITLAFISVIVIFMFVVLSPAVQVFNNSLYVQGAQPLLEEINTNATQIDDPTIVNSIDSAVQNSKNGFMMNSEVLNFFYQYAWLFVISICGLVLLLGSRFLVERQVGGAV